MTQMTVSPQTHDNAKPAQERHVRHGLIEDWRDALGILLLLVVAAFFGALITRAWPSSDDASTGSGSELASRVANLEAKLAAAGGSALKDRVAKIEARITGVETALATSSAANNQENLALPAGTAKLVGDLGTRLTVLETKTATTPDDILSAKTSIETLSSTSAQITTHLDDIAGRLSKLESSDLLDLARRASLATAIANLTRAAQGSSPFKTEYDVVSALVPGDAHLTAIAPLAVKGLPTTGTLIAAFGSRADAALDAERLAKGKTWGTQLWANFSSLVSWRATGETEGNSSESRLARAELRLKAGDLEAAVKELSAIKSAARKPLASWLANAQARVKLETTLAALNTQAIEAITGSAGSSEPVPQLPAP